MSIQRPPFSLRHDAPVGWLVVDLRHSMLATDEEHLQILPSPHYKRFAVNDIGQIMTAGELPSVGTRFPLYVMAKHEKFQRIIAIHVELADESPFKFYRDHYKTNVAANTENGTILLFSAPITIKGLPPEQQPLTFAPISSVAGFPIAIISKEDAKGRGFAQIQLIRPLSKKESVTMEFYLGAFDVNGDQVADCKVTIKVQAIATGPPKFDASHYFTALSLLRAHTNVMRVHAR
ncbi:hypothetical protein COOONC_10718 [Cooperia oncophora]